MPGGCDWPVHTFAAEADPIAAYPFSEGEGEVTADAAGDNDGQLEGAAWAEAGKYGSALDLDGELAQTAPATPAGANGVDVQIGRNPAFGFFEGLVDEVRL